MSAKKKVDERANIGRAANGQDGVGSGYDAEVIDLGNGEAIVGLYRVRTREWVAMGEASIEGRDLDAMARSVASNPGAWALVWDESDPAAYETLAERFDALTEAP